MFYVKRIGVKVLNIFGGFSWWNAGQNGGERLLMNKMPRGGEVDVKVLTKLQLEIVWGDDYRQDLEEYLEIVYKPMN